MENSQEFKKIIKFHPTISNRIITREGNIIEFKLSFNWGSKDEYAKTIAAFSNNKGGFLLFGVENNPRNLIGLKNKKFEDFDEAKITEYLNSVFSPEISWYKFVHTVNKVKLGVIAVENNSNKPVICIKNSGVLKEAEIYYRYNARSDKIKYPELKALLENIQNRERKNWMTLFEKISKIGPSNAAILDLLNGRIDGQRGTLVIDEKLIPKLKFIKEGLLKEKGWPTLKLIGEVRPASISAEKSKRPKEIHLTDDPKALLVKMEEKDIRQKFPFDYKTLTEKLRTRYSDFKQNQKYHDLRKKFKKDKNCCNTRYLDSTNPKSSKKDFYSKKILKRFDKYYKKKKYAKKN